MGRVCAALHADHGTRLLTGTGVAGLDGDGHVTGVRLLDGRSLPADVVLVGIGAQPNVEWLAGSGLDLSGGIATDARGAASIPGVVAAGDCAAPWSETAGRHVRFEHWTGALEQPSAAVAALLGADAAASPRIPYFWSDQYGVRIQFAGTRGPDDKLRVVEGDELPVAGRARVGLQVGVAELDGILEGAPGILRLVPRPTAVGEGERPGVIQVFNCHAVDSSC